jgi:hypothetical protein
MTVPLHDVSAGIMEWIETISFMLMLAVFLLLSIWMCFACNSPLCCGTSWLLDVHTSHWSGAGVNQILEECWQLGLYWHLGLQNVFPRCQDCKVSSLCLGVVYQAIEPVLESRGYQLALHDQLKFDFASFCLLRSCCRLSGILVWFCCRWDARLKAGLGHR